MEQVAQRDAAATPPVWPMARQRRRAAVVQHATWLTLAGSLLLTFVVYWPVLGFSYFHDDVYDLPRTEDVSYAELFREPLEGNRYYRPVTYAVWKAVHDVTGSYPAPLLHAVPLLCHALAGWLLYLLLVRLTGSRWALLAALLFLLFPFSYQALAIMGALFHPLVTVMLLGMLLLWYDGRVRGSAFRQVLAGGLAVLALWSHEYGVAALPLLLALELLLVRRKQVARLTWWLALPAAAELLFVALWLSFDRPPGNPVTARDMLDNLALWLQNMTYPVSRQAVWLADLLGVGAGPLGTLLGLMALSGALTAYWLAGRIWLGLTLLGLAALSFLPAALTLTHGYVLSGPRLFYVVAPACAAFWGLLPGLRPGLVWRAGTLALLGLAIVQSLLFIDRRLEMFEHGSAAVAGVVAAVDAEPGRGHLIINLPAWFAQKEQEYPRGNYGMELAAPYFGLDSLVYIASGAWTNTESRALAPRVFDWRYYLQPHGPAVDHTELDLRLRAGVQLHTVELLPDRVVVREPGTLRWGQPWPGAQRAIFGDSLWLLGSEVQRDGELLTISTEWFAVNQLAGDYQLWYQVRRSDGAVVAEVRDYAMGGMSPPRYWRPVDRVEDRRLLALPPAAGALAVWAAFVSTSDGSLLPVMLPDGALLPEPWYELGPVTE